jgi:hypothetical protein
MAEEQGARPEPRKALTEDKSNPLTRVKLPLWITLAVALILVILFLVLLAGKKTVDLGPSIKGSEVNVCVVLPDSRSNINPGAEERNLEKALQDLGAKLAHARVQRPPDQCPSVPTVAPTPSPTPSR